jgi:hypothetical protein
MKKIANQILAALTRLFRPTCGNTNTNNNSRPPSPAAGPEPEDIRLCNHPRHGAYGARRKFNFRGTSATGREFVVWQCSMPSCGEFVAVTKDAYTGQDHILFRGHHFTPNRERPRQPAFRPLRTANSTT